MKRLIIELNDKMHNDFKGAVGKNGSTMKKEIQKFIAGYISGKGTQEPEKTEDALFHPGE